MYNFSKSKNKSTEKPRNLKNSNQDAKTRLFNSKLTTIDGRETYPNKMELEEESKTFILWRKYFKLLKKK